MGEMFVTIWISSFGSNWLVNYFKGRLTNKQVTAGNKRKKWMGPHIGWSNHAERGCSILQWMNSHNGGPEDDGNIGKKKAVELNSMIPKGKRNNIVEAAFGNKTATFSDAETAGCGGHTAPTGEGCGVCGVFWTSQPSLQGRSRKEHSEKKLTILEVWWLGTQA